MTKEDLKLLGEVHSFLRKSEPIFARLAQRQLQLQAHRHRKILDGIITRLEAGLAAAEPEPAPAPAPKKPKAQRAVYKSLIGDD